MGCSEGVVSISIDWSGKERMKTKKKASVPRDRSEVQIEVAAPAYQKWLGVSSMSPRPGFPGIEGVSSRRARSHHHGKLHKGRR